MSLSFKIATGMIFVNCLAYGNAHVFLQNICTIGLGASIEIFTLFMIEVELLAYWCAPPLWEFSEQLTVP